MLALYNQTLKRKPSLPFCKISEGPVGQFDEMINFFNNIASNKTLGKPSNFEVKMNKSDLLKYGNGFFVTN